MVVRDCTSTSKETIDLLRTCLQPEALWLPWWDRQDTQCHSWDICSCSALPEQSTVSIRAWRGRRAPRNSSGLRSTGDFPRWAAPQGGHAPGRGHGKDAPAFRCASWKVCKGAGDMKALTMLTSCPPSSLLNPPLPFKMPPALPVGAQVLPHFLPRIVPELCHPPVKRHCTLSQSCGEPSFPVISSTSKRSKLSLVRQGGRDSCGLSHPTSGARGCPAEPRSSRQPRDLVPDTAFPEQLIFRLSRGYFRKEDVISALCMYQRG